MLQELQRNFILTLKSDTAEEIKSHLVDYKLKPASRMQIYRNHLRLTLRELLASSYPKLCLFMGDEAFAKLTAGYCHAHPMTSSEAWLFGADLAKYLLANKKDKQQKVLSELASLEWFAQLCFYAMKSTTNIIAQDLALLTPDVLANTQISLAQDSQLICCSNTTYELWQQLSKDDDNVAPPKINLVAQALSYLLIRRCGDGSIEILSLDEGAFTFFTRLETGTSLLGACEYALEVDVDFNIMATYQQALKWNLFVKILIQTEII